MVEGQTGLNIKDYPFAFSIAILLFPNLLSESGNNLQILGVLLIGGMIGSLLTIINPLSLLTKYYYARKHSSVFYLIVFPDIPTKNVMLTNLVEKNFRAALTSPSVSFEIDKTIAMLYFVIILTITIIRSFMGDFTSILKDEQYLIWVVRGLSFSGLVGVILILLRHNFGINFKPEKIKFIRNIYFHRIQQTSLSQLDRIRIVTIANLGIDFANLTNEIDKWRTHGLQYDGIRRTTLKEFYKLNNKVEESLSPMFRTSYASFEDFSKGVIRSSFNIQNESWNDPVIAYLYQRYTSLKEISWRYDVRFSKALSWMYDLTGTLTSLYEIEPQIRASIESRDWDNADLLSYRITDKLGTFLQEKVIPAQINDETKI